MSAPKNQASQNPVTASQGNPANPTNGSSSRDSAASSLLEDKTYIDPTADVVVKSNEGENPHEFRIHSYMLKAWAPKFRETLDSPGSPTAHHPSIIQVDADRKTLKLLLDLITGVMPSTYVWSMRDGLFPLVVEYETKPVAERILTLSCDHYNFVPLAKLALFALACDEANLGQSNGNQGFQTPGAGSFTGSMPGSPQSVYSRRSTRSVPPPPLRGLNGGHLEGVSSVFAGALLQASFAIYEDGDAQLSKKSRKMMAEHEGNQFQSFGMGQGNAFMGHPHSPQQHHQGLGLSFHPSQQQHNQQYQPFQPPSNFGGKNPKTQQQQHEQQLAGGKKGGFAGGMQQSAVLAR